MKKLVIIFFGIIFCFNLSAETIKLRNGMYVQKEVVEQKWQALKSFADQHPKAYRWILISLAQQCEKAQKDGRVCSNLHFAGSWQIVEDSEIYRKKLKDLNVLANDGTVDKETCSVIVSAFSGTIDPYRKGPMMLYILPWQLLPKMVDPRSSLLGKIPGYDRICREYIPAEKNKNPRN